MKLPKEYSETAIYQRLLSIGDNEAIEQVKKMIEAVTPYLELVGREAFDNFTIHTAQHSLNLMGYASEIIPIDTLTKLSSVEIMVLIMTHQESMSGIKVFKKKRCCLLMLII